MTSNNQKIVTFNNQKIGDHFDLAWRTKKETKSAILYVDSEKRWGARRNLINNANIDCVYLIAGLAEEHSPTDFVSAVLAPMHLGYEELCVIAIGSAVLPTLSVAETLRPKRLLLVNPLLCAHENEYWHAVRSSLDKLHDTELVKLFHSKGDLNSDGILSLLEKIECKKKIVPLNNMDVHTISLFRSTGYASSVAANAGFIPDFS